MKFQIAACLKVNQFVSLVPEDFSLESDENALRFVLRNLVSNARKFTENGRISIGARRDDDGRVRLVVSDTGMGMSEEVRSRLFNAHQRQSAPGTQCEKGSGLGLLLVQEYIGKIGGSLEIQSAVVQGTVVEIRL